MPEESPTPTSPSKAELITIYVRPAVRKFVLARLSDPQRVYFDSRSRALWEQLQLQLRGRHLVRVVNNFDPASDRPSERLVLEVVAVNARQADVSWSLHRYVRSTLQKAYVNEMREWVAWYVAHMHKEQLQALEMFRAAYGITEEDHARDTAYRMLHYRSVKSKRRKRVAARR